MSRMALVWPARLLGLGAVVAVLALLPRTLEDFTNAYASDLAFVAIYFTALLGLSILTGYSGQISLGHGAFMAIGGYTTAILMSEQGLRLAGHTFSSDLRDVYTIPIAGVVAGLAGLLFGLPALRLTGLYLALATFAVAVALPQVLRRFETLTGGGTGIQLFGLPQLSGLGVEVNVFGRTLPFNDWLYYLCWSIALALLVAAWLLLRGRLGRALRAVRDSEVAAASSGVSLARYKTLAFAISAFYAGVAGSLFAIATTFVNPDVFPITLSIFLVIGAAIGGYGSLLPLLAGALFVQYVRNLGDDAADAGRLPGPVAEFLARPGGRDLVFGATLIVAMFLLPNGIGGLLRRAAEPLTSRLYTRAS